MIAIETLEKMPEHCYECPCVDSENGRCQVDTNIYSDLRPAICPLVEIPDLQDIRDAQRWALD